MNTGFSGIQEAKTLNFITLNEKYINIELLSIKSYNITYKPIISGGL